MPNPLNFDFERVLANVRRSTTEDLLDRVTAFRPDMEPEAIEIIERELHSRGVTEEQIIEHAARQAEPVKRPDGTTAKCSFCPAAAVAAGWGWFRLFRKVPIFPIYQYYCSAHRPDASAG